MNSFSASRFSALFVAGVTVHFFAGLDATGAGLARFSDALLTHVEQRFGSSASDRLFSWQHLLSRIPQERAYRTLPPLSSDGRTEMPILAEVNRFFNRIPYYTDPVHWRVPDYWATPVEFLGSNGGDCEDYAIAKYLSLKDLGFPVQRMRITYVRALTQNEPHMVLAYYPTPDADPWILDNLIDEIHHGSERTDLVPVYSFNDDDLWIASGKMRKGGATSVRLWSELQEKLRQEQHF